MAACAFPHPDGKPPGRQSQMAHSSSDAAWTVGTVGITPMIKIAIVKSLKVNFIVTAFLYNVDV